MAKVKIDYLVKKVLESRKNANELISIIDHIKPQEEESWIISSSKGAVKIFQHLIFHDDVKFAFDSSHALSSVGEYKAWVGERYSECFSAMLQCLPGLSADNKPVLMGNCLELLKQKSHFLNKFRSKRDEMLFAETELCELLKTILSESTCELVNHFQPYVKFDDMRYFALKILPTVFCEMKIDEENDCIIEMVLTFLECLSSCMPTVDIQLKNSIAFENFDCLPCKTDPFSINEQRKVFSRAWLEVMKLSFSSVIHKRILIMLHSTLIPHFSKPRLLADFLIRSFKCGGGLALLGLHGLFVLMNEHNLEYPDFYVNLYTMLHPRIFEKKYKARFFNLLQVFLSSTHLPIYLVAAFIKKLSRLLLVAPPHCTLVMLGLISKLLLQHPDLVHLLHQTNQNCCIEKDVFLCTEPNPANCRALESSLWEIECLMQHYTPEIAKAAASLISLELDDSDINAFVDSDYTDLIDFDGSEFKSHAMNHIQANSLFRAHEGITTEIWSIE